MSLHANSLFPTTPTTQAGTWKPVSKADSAGKSLVATAFSPPSAQGADSVTVSPLGKALTGVAAKVFERLDNKARGMLEGYVKAGVMTAEEVVGGLRAIGKEAVQNRYMNKLWEEDGGAKASAVDAREENYKKQMQFMDGAAEIMTNLAEAGLEGTDDSASRTKEMMQSAQDYAENFKKENGDFAVLDYSQDQSYIAKSVRDLKDSTLFSEEGDGQFFSKSDTASLSKLIDLGFDSVVYAGAAKAAVAEIDLSGVQKTSSNSVAMPAAEAATPQQAEQGMSENAVPQTDATSTGPVPSALKTPENDAMMALLKANAEKTPDWQGVQGLRNAPSPSGATGSDTTLAALTKALKDGGQAAGQGTAAGRTDTVV
ncbi:hypothetical protein [Azospirillum sp. B506]|uniref:hypothetical protein n=1 Tax=Azospirillum sp. B506 TaxID=137721 RepID=UPI000344BC9D|nr:hypothetical protein [Azospirillum sp. B506]